MRRYVADSTGIERRDRGIMSTPAGWYPQPDGQQRYWDGQQWTENFAPGNSPGVPEGASSETAPGAARKNWFLRHKVITAVGAVLLVAMLSDLVPPQTKPPQTRQLQTKRQRTKPPQTRQLRTRRQRTKPPQTRQLQRRPRRTRQLRTKRRQQQPRRRRRTS